MANKTIPLRPHDLERLRELIRQEEARMDAANPSDTELDHWEADLEASIRAQVKPQAETSDSDSAALQRNWQKIQQVMTAKMAPDVSENAPAQIISFRKKNQLLLPWLGGVAAAALLLIMLKPQAADTPVATESTNQTFKGNAVSDFAADCELAATARNGAAIVTADDGQGFQGPLGADVEVNVRCSKDGFIQVQVSGPESMTMRNIPIKSGVRQGLTLEGKSIHLPLPAHAVWTLVLVLTDHELDRGQNLPLDKVEKAQYSGLQVLWMDKIVVRGHSE